MPSWPWEVGTAAACRPTSLSAADFPQVREEEFDQHVVPADYKLEARPRDPPTYLSWARQVRNYIRAFCCILGQEHESELTACLEGLCRRHEQTDHKYTLEFSKGAWEELNWAWTEELRASIRDCKKLFGKERPRKDDLVSVALTQTAEGQAYFQYPTAFDLEDPRHTTIGLSRPG